MDKGVKLLIKQATKNNSRGDYFHSSGYARAQSGAHIGAGASGETFKTRQKRQREFVREYGDSRLTRDAITTKIRTNPPKKVDQSASDVIQLRQGKTPARHGGISSDG